MAKGELRPWEVSGPVVSDEDVQIIPLKKANIIFGETTEIGQYGDGAPMEQISFKIRGAKPTKSFQDVLGILSVNQEAIRQAIES